MSANTNDNQKSPDGSTQVSAEEKKNVEQLPDGSQSNGSSDTEEDTASGGPAD